MLKKLIVVLLGVVVVLTMNSCGYQLGSIMHPQVKSIAIGDVKNDTTAFNVSVELQQLLSEQFMLDGSLKVLNRREADAIIFAKIISISFTELAGRTMFFDNYSPMEWEVRVVIEFSVIIPGQKQPLIPRTSVIGRTAMQLQGDSEIGRQRAIYMACRDAAQLMVQKTTEAW